jgi:nitrilase
LPFFATEIDKLGALIFWENHMPLLRMAMFGKGIQLSRALTAGGSDSWLAAMHHIVCEVRAFVLSFN